MIATKMSCALADAETVPVRGFVQVQCGVKEFVVPSGLTVDQIRSRFGLALALDATSQAVVNGILVDADHTPTAGQRVSFTRQAGEKG